VESRREKIPAVLAGERLDRVVALLTGLPRSEVARLVAAGAVRVGPATVRSRSRHLAEGETLEVDVPDRVEDDVVAGEADVVFAVLYADDDIVVVDKPAGLVVHPGAGHRGGTLVHGLLARFPDLAGVGPPDRPGIVHRLDKGTSGLLVVARSERAYAGLVAQLQARTVSRRYDTLVWGRLEGPTGIVDAPVGRSGRDPTRMTVTGRGREARTTYEVTARYARPEPLSRLTCRLETGRTHQIRVHLSAIGHPVVGDARYGGQRSSLHLGRPFLHASALSFVHPGTGDGVTFSSPLPADLASVLASLGPEG
jgi:23S rRNA pseudouridine1911/1915/1917 synthase